MTAHLFLLIMVYSLIATIFGLLIYRGLITGFLYRMYCLITALPGILADFFIQIWLSIVGLLPHKKKRDSEIELDDYERMLS